MWQQWESCGGSNMRPSQVLSNDVLVDVHFPRHVGARAWLELSSTSSGISTQVVFFESKWIGEPDYSGIQAQAQLPSVSQPLGLPRPVHRFPRLTCIEKLRNHWSSNIRPIGRFWDLHDFRNLVFSNASMPPKHCIEIIITMVWCFPKAWKYKS